MQAWMHCPVLDMSLKLAGCSKAGSLPKVSGGVPEGWPVGSAGVPEGWPEVEGGVPNGFPDVGGVPEGLPVGAGSVGLPEVEGGVNPKQEYIMKGIVITAENCKDNMVESHFVKTCLKASAT